jgi:Xaa-Pro aminopeptidase
MSGPNSALAYRAFAATGTRLLRPGDLVLVHMNPQIGGFWSDLTRTFILGAPDDRRREMLEAMLVARTAALAAIRPGAEARAVDAAARDSLATLGFGEACKHQTGHGVGFNGISGADAPALHPLSHDILTPGACFNVEPSIYLDDVGGCRHCDVVRVGDVTIEQLSPYLATLEDLTIAC